MQALGRYELLRPLARGGMADVYLARRRVAGVEKRLVIKRMRRDHSRDPRFLELFVREAQLSMALVQKNIVPVFDFGRIGDDVFLAMEHIDGRDLGSTLARGDAPVPPLVAAFIAAECCEALDHAHNRRDPVIHRDVTARNVLLSWSGEVKLADFGIAAVAGQGGASTIGTAAYMSPEQARGDAVDARADLYALGMVLWEALSGGHVRPTETRAERLAAARRGDLPPLAAAIPEALAAIIRRTTAVDPADRYASAREMADALDAYIVAERARDPGPPPAARLRAWLRGRWGETTDEADGDAAEVAAPGRVVTFLDDGADQIRTQRSMAETVGEAAPPPPRVEPPPPAPASSRRWLAPALGAIGLAAGLVAIWRPWASDDAAPAAPAPAAPPVAVAPRSIEVSPEPAPPPPSQPTPESIAKPAPPRKTPKPEVRSPKPSPPPTAAVARRTFTIGARPWANVRIDNDPTEHETPVTLELTVGPHKVTFTNPTLGVDRTVTVTVPAEGPARHVENLER